MRLPTSFYQMQQTLAQRLPCLSATHCQGLTLWVYGTLLAQSACQNAVLSALQGVAAWNTLRQALREWLYNGADKAAPCSTQVEVGACFPALLAWVLAWWQDTTLPLALDATAHKDRLVALVVSVLYRGNAIPVAWMLLPAQQSGAWEAHWERLLRALAAVVPTSQRVLVLCDRGLWSPRLYRQITALTWHPLMRVQNSLLFAPSGQTFVAARTLVARVPSAWVGTGSAFRTAGKTLACTLVAVWLPAQKEPCLVLTDLPVGQVGVLDYSLRMWIEAGFCVLKRLGWQWERTQRSDPLRASRHFLVLAVATLWTLACGTRLEDADQTPGSCALSETATGSKKRRVSVFRLGVYALRRQLLQNWVWKRLYLRPQPLPQLASEVPIVYYSPPDTS